MFGRGKVFPQVLHVAGFIPDLYPFSTTESEQDPLQPEIPHLMIGRPATGAMRCTTSRCAHSSSEPEVSHPSGSSKFDRSGALGPPGSREGGNLPPLALHATNMQFRQNMLTFATLLGSLRDGIITTLMSVREIEFRLKANRQRKMFRVTACALDVPITQRSAMQEFFLVVFAGNFVACARMVENVTRVSC